MKTKGKICLVVSFIVLLFLLIVPYYLYVGRSTTISNDGKDWADFASYFAAFGTMIFTAVYAIAFILLRDSVKQSADFQKQNLEESKKENARNQLAISILNIIGDIEDGIDQSEKSLYLWNVKQGLTELEISALGGQLEKIKSSKDNLKELADKTYYLNHSKWNNAFSMFDDILVKYSEYLKDTFQQNYVNKKSWLLKELDRMRNVSSTIKQNILIEILSYSNQNNVGGNRT